MGGKKPPSGKELTKFPLEAEWFLPTEEEAVEASLDFRGRENSDGFFFGLHIHGESRKDS
eukprot:CAMPEP_0201905616 /NCGR_PEP_ID=MMETSP0902-20130614/56601_2 /ASSEMBLY_ACC=CAM_ASM_000551 /TAXON_ID=420261 /ORGANISM="Thalassiosira antarctica, Strain CCMP982" /LENGTH=59 /DNA_ID=CAMNT_0048439731 /DNA_START=435 /DNA_END=614 /DNA_ORIENTATION=-